MGWLCKVFGHKAPSYAMHKGWGGWDYGRLSLETTDGLARQHARVFGDCARCEREFLVCRVHLPQLQPNDHGANHD